MLSYPPDLDFYICAIQGLYWLRAGGKIRDTE
jgi:hypothetical protein